MSERCCGPSAKNLGDLFFIRSSIRIFIRSFILKMIKSAVVEQMNSHCGDLFDKALKEALIQPSKKGSAEIQSSSFSLLDQKQSDLKKHKSSLDPHREKGSLIKKQKVFIAQPSLLDELLEVNHFGAIYNIFVAILCIFALSTILVDLVEEGRILLGFELFVFAFGNLPRALFAWLWMFLYSLFGPYKILQTWANWLKTATYPRLLTTATAVVLLVCHAAVLGLYPLYAVIYYDLGPASCFVVLIEQVRLLMKIHSFLRESVPPILHGISKDGKVHIPEFSTYLYFLFCPTLIYRESYPRTPSVRWRYVIKNFAQFLLGVFYINLVLERLTLPVFPNLSKQPFSFKTLVLSICSATLPGVFLILLVFFSFLHCWLNAFAEMLRFADRCFYKDWWNATSFPTHYRKWNIVVHDWIYYYIYLEVNRLFHGKANFVAMLSSITSSAVVHEYVYSLSFGFFYPVSFVLFAVLGVIANLIVNDNKKGSIWNVYFWTLHMVGHGILVSLYSQEWYARVNCPLQEITFWGIVTPRSWSCYT